MTTPDQPGWYDDPHDSNAQRYWDGQDWTPHRQRKPTTAKRQPVPPPPPPLSSPPPPPLPPPPAAGTTPWDQLGPYVDKLRPAAAKGQQFWSGLSRQRQIIFAVVGLVAIVIVFAFGAHLFRSGGPQTSSASGSGKSAYAGADKSSQSYQMGLKAGTDGQAEIAAYGGFDILTHQNTAPMSYEDACKGQFDIEHGAAPSEIVERDYMAGCLDGLNHQSAQWTQGRKAKGGN